MLTFGALRVFNRCTRLLAQANLGNPASGGALPRMEDVMTCPDRLTVAAGCRWHDDAESNKMCRLGAGGAAMLVKSIAELTSSGINQSSVESQEGPAWGPCCACCPMSID